MTNDVLSETDKEIIKKYDNRPALRTLLAELFSNFKTGDEIYIECATCPRGPNYQVYGKILNPRYPKKNPENILIEEGGVGRTVPYVDLQGLL